MATLVLGALGTASGVPGGGFVGAAVGGIIDNYLLFPALFPVDPQISGARLDGIALSGANEGTPIEWCIGPFTRVPATVIWLDEIEEVEHTTDIGGSGGGGSIKSYTYYISFAAAICEANDPQIINRIRKILADAKPIFDETETAKYDAIEFHLGDQTTPDSYLEGRLGAGNVPTFKNIVYFVVQRLLISDYGNRVPNMQGFPEQDLDVSVAEAIEMIVERHGLDPVVDIDVRRIPFCFKGLAVSGPQQGTEVLNNVMATYALTAQEADGKIIFFPRGSEISVSVITADIGFSGNPGILITDSKEFAIPSISRVRYVSQDLDLQPGLEPFRNQSTTQEGTRITMDTPLTLSSVEASALAKRFLWASVGEREKVALTLPPSYQHVVAGDALEFTFEGVTYYIYCREVNIGANYQIRIDGHKMDISVYEQTGIGNAGGYNPPDGYRAPQTVPIYVDCSAIVETHINKSGFYFATHTDPSTETFLGAVLHSSIDGITYEARQTIPRKAIMGITDRGPEITINPLFVDDISELEVTLIDGTLSSATLQEVVEGTRNICAVETAQLERGEGTDWEIIGFVNVTDLGNSQYRLTKLIRGLRGTENLSKHHRLSGARFVLLKADNSVRFWEGGNSIIGVNLFLKLPAEGGLLSDYEARLFKSRGRSNLCFPPANVRWYLGTTTDMNPIIEWTRRTKLFVDHLDGANGAAMSDDETNGYQITIRPGGSLMKPIFQETIVQENTIWEFTQAKQQIAEDDLESPWVKGDGFSFEIRHISSFSGPGRPSIITVDTS